jgi:hypothetical protein
LICSNLLFSRAYSLKQVDAINFAFVATDKSSGADGDLDDSAKSVNFNSPANFNIPDDRRGIKASIFASYSRGDNERGEGNPH